MTLTHLNEPDGIKAIIYLQSLAGITEPPKKAKEGWRAMTQDEKIQTMTFFHLLGGSLKETDRNQN